MESKEKRKREREKEREKERERKGKGKKEQGEEGEGTEEAKGKEKDKEKEKERRQKRRSRLGRSTGGGEGKKEEVERKRGGSVVGGRRRTGDEGGRKNGKPKRGERRKSRAERAGKRGSERGREERRPVGGKVVVWLGSEDGDVTVWDTHFVCLKKLKKCHSGHPVSCLVSAPFVGEGRGGSSVPLPSPASSLLSSPLPSPSGTLPSPSSRLPSPTAQIPAPSSARLPSPSQPLAHTSCQLSSSAFTPPPSPSSSPHLRSSPSSPFPSSPLARGGGEEEGPLWREEGRKIERAVWSCSKGERAIRVWDVQTYELLQMISCGEKEPSCLGAVEGKEMGVVVGAGDGELCVVSVRGSEERGSGPSFSFGRREKVGEGENERGEEGREESSSAACLSFGGKEKKSEGGEGGEERKEQGGEEGKEKGTEGQGKEEGRNNDLEGRWREGHKGAVSSIVYLSVLNQIWTSSLDGSVRSWNISPSSSSPSPSPIPSPSLSSQTLPSVPPPPFSLTPLGNFIGHKYPVSTLLNIGQRFVMSGDVKGNLLVNILFFFPSCTLI